MFLLAHFSRSSLACPWCFHHPSRSSSSTLSFIIHSLLIGIPHTFAFLVRCIPRPFIMNFIRSVFQSFIGLEPQLQHPRTETLLPEQPDFDYNPILPEPIDDIEFNLPPPIPSSRPAPRHIHKQRSMKVRPQPSAHRRQTRLASPSPDEPMHDLAVGRIFETKEDAKEAIHAAVLKAGQSWRVARGKKDTYAVKCFSNKDKNDNPFDCKFRVHVTRTDHDLWEIRTYRPHTCPSQNHKRIEASHVGNKPSRMSSHVILSLLQPSLRQSQSHS